MARVTDQPVRIGETDDMTSGYKGRRGIVSSV